MTTRAPTVLKMMTTTLNMITITLNMITTTLDMMTTTYKYWILRSPQNMSTNCLHNLSLKKNGNNWWKLLKLKADDHSRGGWLFRQTSRPQNCAGLNPLCDNHLLVFVSWLFAQLSRLPSFLLESKINVDRYILNKITLLRRRSAMREPRRWARRARGRDPRRVVVVWSGSRWGPSGGGCPSQPHPASQRVRDGPDGQWWGWSEKAETTWNLLPHF